MKMKKWFALFTAVLMVLMLAACGGSASSAAPASTAAPAAPAESTAPAASAPPADSASADAPAGEKTPLKIGVSIMELTAYTWYQGVIDGCNQWLAENGEAMGVDIEFTFEDSRSDVQTMLTNVENMVSASNDGIILFPADASSAIPLMKQYTAEGIPFVIGDYAQETQSADDVVWSTFVGHDMKALGVKAGEVAVEYLNTLGKEDPTCVYISRPTSGQVSQDRFTGFSETVLAAFPGAKIVEEGDTGAGNRDSAQTLMENVLQRESVVDVVCGHNDAEVVGAYNACVAQSRTETKFVGIAGDINVLEWIGESNEAWLGEVLQDPVVLGYQATDAIVRVLLNGEDLPENYALPEPEAITPANIAGYDWQSWSWLG